MNNDAHEFKYRLDDIPKGYYNVSISNGGPNSTDVGSSNGAGIGNPNTRRGHSMIAKDGDSGGFAFSAMNGATASRSCPSFTESA